VECGNHLLSSSVKWSVQLPENTRSNVVHVHFCENNVSRKYDEGVVYMCEIVVY